MDNFSGPQKAAGSSFTLTLLKSLSLPPVERLKKYFLTKEKALQTFPENLGDTISLLHYLIEWLCSDIIPLVMPLFDGNKLFFINIYPITVNVYQISKNIQALGHNPFPQPSPNEEAVRKCANNKIDQQKVLH